MKRRRETSWKNLLLLVFPVLLGVCFSNLDVATANPSFEPDHVELLLMAPSTRVIESRFGHAALLIVPKGHSWDEGYVYSLNAKTHPTKTENERLRNFVVGNFPFTVEIEPALAFFHKTLVSEARDIQRSILPLTEKQKQSLLQTLMDFQRHPEKLGDYYFQYRNCASMLYFVLKQSGTQANYTQLRLRGGFVGIAPSELIKDSRNVLLNPFPTETLPSIATLVRQLELKYEVSLRSVRDSESKEFLAWSPSDLQKLSKMSLEELVIAMQAIPIIDPVRGEPLRKLIVDFNRRIKIEFVRFREYPDSFYSVCSEGDTLCYDRLVQDLAKVYPLEDLKRLYYQNRTDELRAEQLYQPEFNVQTSEQSQHWHRLTAALRAYLKSKH